MFVPRLLEDQVVYEPGGPWPDANGSGRSLTRSLTTGYGGFPTSWQAAQPSPGRSVQAGDTNGDGQINADDVDTVCDGIQRGDLAFDFNSDRIVDRDDLDYFVESILYTSAGDANVDGQFDTSDLVQVLQAGEYEDGVVGNSTWAEGDWNCDREFDTADLVAALQTGRYETAASVAVKGEPVIRSMVAVQHQAEDNAESDVAMLLARRPAGLSSSDLQDRGVRPHRPQDQVNRHAATDARPITHQQRDEGEITRRGRQRWLEFQIRERIFMGQSTFFPEIRSELFLRD